VEGLLLFLALSFYYSAFSLIFNISNEVNVGDCHAFHRGGLRVRFPNMHFDFRQHLNAPTLFKYCAAPEVLKADAEKIS
jgi:hypothetical protein